MAPEEEQSSSCTKVSRPLPGSDCDLAIAVLKTFYAKKKRARRPFLKSKLLSLCSSAFSSRGSHRGFNRSGITGVGGFAGLGHQAQCAGLFGDAGCLAGQAAQVIKLGTA